MTGGDECCGVVTKQLVLGQVISCGADVNYSHYSLKTAIGLLSQKVVYEVGVNIVKRPNNLRVDSVKRQLKFMRQRKERRKGAGRKKTGLDKVMRLR